MNINWSATAAAVELDGSDDIDEFGTAYSCAAIAIQKKYTKRLSVGELNPGRPRDRQTY